MQKTVKLTSLNEGDDFYHSGFKYKLSRFNGHYLGVKCDLTLVQFIGTSEVQIDCKSVRITDIKTGDRFSLGTSKVYYKTDMTYYGEYVCVNEKYEVTFVRETYNIYPID